METKHQQIQNIIQTIFEKMGFPILVESLESAGCMIFNVKTSSDQDAYFLAQNDASNIVSLNHLVKKITSSLLKSEDFQFFLDINDYQKQKNEAIKDLALMAAQKVRYFKKEIILDTMNSYERRVIHLALADYSDLYTESVGEGGERRIVIKPRV